MKLESWFKSQEEKDFVKREIDGIMLCNEFAELYLKSNDDCYDIITNIYVYECQTCGEQNDEEFECCDETVDDCVSQEIMQWFLVDSYLAKRLEEIGEPVLHTDSHTLWGRTCCGQAVELDGTFQKIYRNLDK